MRSPRATEAVFSAIAKLVQIRNAVANRLVQPGLSMPQLVWARVVEDGK